MESPPDDHWVVVQQPDTRVAGLADVAPELLAEVAVVKHPLVGVVPADRTLARRWAGMLRSQAPPDV